MRYIPVRYSALIKHDDLPSVAAALGAGFLITDAAPNMVCRIGGSIYDFTNHAKRLETARRKNLVRGEYEKAN